MPDKKTTILQIIPRLDTGGAELSTIEITQALVLAGARALVATDGGRMTDQVTSAGGELVEMPAATKNPAILLANARRLATLIRRAGVDLVHARSRAPAWSALMAARRARVPFVTTYHGAYNERGPFKRAYNRVMARGDIVIANSNWTAELIRGRYKTPEKKIRVIPRGVDLNAFDSTSVSAERMAALRDAWGVAPHTRIVLQPARLTSWKGQRTVIEAISRMRTAGVFPADAAVVLAGDAQGRSEYRADLVSRIQAAGLGDVIHLPGHCADMPAAFALSEVAIVASIEPEAFGRTAAEAQAAGCPVIATAIGGPQETVLTGKNGGPRTGWLVPPADAGAMADALGTALTLPAQTRAAMVAAARPHIVANFSSDSMKRLTLAAYDELLAAGLEQAYVQATAVAQEETLDS